MSELVVAGGSGQEVAASALRLSYLAGIEMPHVTVFDSDVAPRDAGSGAQTRTQVLDDLQKRMQAAGMVNRDLLDFVNPTVLADVAARIHKVEDLFATHGTLANADRDLLDLLLDAKQQAITVSDGFHGHPAVGSLVFSGALQRGAFKGFVERLERRAQEQQGLRVVFAASVAGGVGTAVIPVLLRNLVNLREKVGGSKVTLLALMQLPWFKLVKTSGDGLSQEPDVDQAMFDRNAACLLRGYLDQALIKNIDSLLLLGLPQPAERVSQGGHQQLETKHYLCLIAGMHALNLLSEEPTRKSLGEDWRGLHAVTLGSGAGAFDGTPHGPELYAARETALSVRKLINIARCLVAFTDALLFELQCRDPVAAQHPVVRRTLRALRTPQEREAFARTIEGLHRHHAEIHDWLKECLRARVGAKRADELGFFDPDEDWEDMFSHATGAALKRTGTWLRWPALGRRLIQRLGPLKPPAENARGREAAWSLVRQARDHLIQRL